MKTLLLILIAIGFAKDLPTAKVDGEYRAERDISEQILEITLKNYAVTVKLASSEPGGSPTEIKGEYFIKDDIITMTFDRVRCKVKYSDTASLMQMPGPGLELLPAAGKRPALCSKPFRKISK